MFLPTPTTNCTSELQHLPLPQSLMDQVALKVSQGIASEMILESLFILILTVCIMTIQKRYSREGWALSQQTYVALSKKYQESTSFQNKTSALSNDRQIKRPENDAMSVGILVQELQNEPFNSILFYKPKGSESEKLSLKKYSFFQTEF